MFLTRKKFRDGPKEMLGMIPGEAPALDFGTCALIGSSGVLTGSKLGRAIDGHDAVLRLNQAPATEDFAEDVGSRVDLRLLNKRWGVAYGEQKYRKLILNDPRNMTLVATRAGPGNFVKLRQSAKELGVQNEMLFMRPKAVRATQDALLFFRESLEVALGEQLASPNGRNSATTGLLGMFLLLEMYGSLEEQEPPVRFRVRLLRPRVLVHCDLPLLHAEELRRSAAEQRPPEPLVLGRGLAYAGRPRRGAGVHPPSARGLSLRRRRPPWLVMCLSHGALHNLFISNSIQLFFYIRFLQRPCGMTGPAT